MIQHFIFLLVTSLSTLPSSDFTYITPALHTLKRIWSRHSITNIVFSKSNNPVLSKALSEMASHLASLALPSLVMATGFYPKMNWLIILPIETAII